MWLERLRHRDQAEPEAENARPELEKKLDLVRACQTRRIVERVEQVLAPQPNANTDTLALPASVGPCSLAATRD